MLQSAQVNPNDELRPYLRAANVQPGGRIADDDLRQMWFADPELSAYSLAAGDVVVVEGGSVGRSAIVREGQAGLGFQNSILRLRPGPLLRNRFECYWMEHLLACGYVGMTVNAATIAHYTVEKVKASPVVLPPMDAQDAIADFLDRETEEIDAFVVDQECLIELLSERKEAVVEAAVWPLPEGGSATNLAATLPSLPDGWRMVRNKNIFQVRRDTSVEGDEEMLSVSHITGVTPRSEKKVTMFEAESTTGYPLVYPGDLVVNTMWAWMGAAGVSSHVGIVSPAYGVYEPFSDEYCGEFFDLLIRTRRYVAAMTANSRGIRSSRLRLYPEVFLAMPVPLPPIQVQHDIVARVGRSTSEIEAAIRDAQRSIELSRERRSALIGAAVTGQLNVTGRRP
jgi:type I restriction enzyme S subunit